jgi:hypothetical protein
MSVIEIFRQQQSYTSCYLLLGRSMLNHGWQSLTARIAPYILDRIPRR